MSSDLPKLHSRHHLSGQNLALLTPSHSFVLLTASASVIAGTTGAWTLTPYALPWCTHAWEGGDQGPVAFF